MNVTVIARAVLEIFILTGQLAENLVHQELSLGQIIHALHATRPALVVLLISHQNAHPVVATTD